MANITAGMQRWAGRVALVTGASSGIGQGIARALVRHGMVVIGCARNIKAIEQDIQRFAEDSSLSNSLYAIKCDLSLEDEILAMFAEIKDKFGGVDVLISNAGVNNLKLGLGILDGETDKWRNMLNVNILAHTICSREAFKQMEEKGTQDGQIIMTSSLSGRRVPPEKIHHFNCVTKFGVTALVEGIRRELREKNSSIRVAAISPGLVETQLREHLNPNEDSAQGKKVYNALEEPLQADDIADSVLYILQAPPHVQVHDILIRSVTQRN